MNKVNIANYIVYDLSNRFNTAELNNIDDNIINMIAEDWHKKHFVAGFSKNIKINHPKQISQKFII